MTRDCVIVDLKELDNIYKVKLEDIITRWNYERYEMPIGQTSFFCKDILISAYLRLKMNDDMIQKKYLDEFSQNKVVTMGAILNDDKILIVPRKFDGRPYSYGIEDVMRELIGNAMCMYIKLATDHNVLQIKELLGGLKSRQLLKYYNSVNSDNRLKSAKNLSDEDLLKLATQIYCNNELCEKLYCETTEVQP